FSRRDLPRRNIVCENTHWAASSAMAPCNLILCSVRPSARASGEASPLLIPEKPRAALETVPEHRRRSASSKRFFALGRERKGAAGGSFGNGPPRRWGSSPSLHARRKSRQGPGAHYRAGRKQDRRASAR